MTSTRPSVEHAWERTQLWLDDLYGESSEPQHTVEPVAAETVSNDDDDGGDPQPAQPGDDAATEPVASVAAVTDAPQEPTPASCGDDATDDAPEPPTTTNAAESHVEDDHGDEFGPWWLQEPPADYHDYADLDPINLDEPLSPAPPHAKGGKRRGGRSTRNAHSAPTASLPAPDDPGDVFDAAEDHAWMADSPTAPSAAVPVVTPTARTAPLNAVDDAARTPPRFNKALALGFLATTVVGTIAVTSMLLGMRRDPTPDAGMGEDGSTQISVVAAAPPSATADPGADTAIPYVASADCPAGSTPAQSVAGGDPSRAWVCVRGGVDGQVLTLDLGRTMLVTAVSITPGWVGSDAAGNDQWLAHRVLTRVQWVFDGDPSTVMTQMTGNIRGEAVQPVPGRGVLASKITMIVLQTSRPPADVPPTPAPGSSGSIFDPALPPVGPSLPASAGPTETFSLPGLPASSSSTDPVDSTFAVSAIKVLGHPPA
jgi:hypothetical protein